MPLIDLAMQHGQRLEEARIEEARNRQQAAVHKVLSQFGALVRRVTWSADHRLVRLEGTGLWVELWVDTQEVHATGDIPRLGALLGNSVGTGLKQLPQQTLRNQLT